MGPENLEGCSTWCFPGTPSKSTSSDLFPAPLVCKGQQQGCGTTLPTEATTPTRHLTSFHILA